MTVNEGAAPTTIGRSDGGPRRLVERDRELSAIGAAIDDSVRGHGRLVVVEGDAGIGKSSLLRAAAEMAVERGMQPLRASGHELEQLHSFGVGRALLEPLLRTVGGPDRLEGQAEPARRILEPVADADIGVGDPLAIFHAVRWLLLDASERTPLLLVVDDLHWVDEPSLRLLAYLAHRLESLPVAMVLATRPTASPAPEVGEQLTGHREAVRLPLRRLSLDGVETLLASSTEGEADPEAVWRQTGGNPFYVVELLRASDAATDLSAGSVPDAIRASIRRRLAASGDGARAVAEAVAVLGEESTLSMVASLAGVDHGTAVSMTRELTARGILGHEGLWFGHPIVHATVLDDVPAPVLAELRRKAARLLVGAGRPAMAAAAHLLETPGAGDPWSVDVLRTAARLAQAQGDASTAAALLARALAEPPPPDDRGRILLELASAEAAAGDPAADERFDAAVATLTQRHERAQARLAQGHAHIQSARWQEAAAAFRAGLDEVEAGDVELKSRLEAGYISSAYVALTDRTDADIRLKRILSAPLHDPAHRELAAWTAFQQTMGVTATASEAAALARRSMQGAAIEQLIASSQVVELVAGVLVASGDVDEELGMLGDALTVARRMNAHQKLGIYSYCRSLPNLLTGCVLEAIADAETALAVHENGWEVFYPGTRAVLAWAQLERGDIAAAQAAVAVDDARWEQRLDYQFMLRIARGRVRSAVGDHAGAIEQFGLARDAGAAMGVNTVSILADWRSWCAIDLRRSGARTDAVAVAEEGLELARRWRGTYGEGRALMAYGIALGDRDGLGHLEEAVDGLTASPIRLEAARALVELGAAQRRLGRTVLARETLGRGADLAHRLNATALADRARDELRAAGARPRRYVVSGVSALTPSEHRVARMAAEGLTNREIAEALFVTPKAVEYHLANAYRKLDISGRSGLAAALDEDAPTASV